MNKQLDELNLKDWFIRKQHQSFMAAYVNTAYTYEVIKQTEKAIQINILRDGKDISWTMWMPKSASEDLTKALA